MSKILGKCKTQSDFFPQRSSQSKGNDDQMLRHNDRNVYNACISMVIRYDILCNTLTPHIKLDLRHLPN